MNLLLIICLVICFVSTRSTEIEVLSNSLHIYPKFSTISQSSRPVSFPTYAPTSVPNYAGYGKCPYHWEESGIKRGGSPCSGCQACIGETICNKCESTLKSL